MNAIFSRHQRWICCVIAVGNLVLAAPAFLGQEDGRAARRRREVIHKMIDDLANRNKTPQLVKVDKNLSLPRFPIDYDWEEQKRVEKALSKVAVEMTAEVWEELIKKAGDTRYSLTLKNNSGLFTLGNWTVGDFCCEIAYDGLLGVFRQHLPEDPIRGDGRKLYVDVGVNLENLADWYKKRKNKPLFELQIELCVQVLKELAKVEKVPQDQKNQARKKIEREIENLRKTKRAVIVESDLFGWLDCYTAEEAKKYREKLGRKR